MKAFRVYSPLGAKGIIHAPTRELALQRARALYGPKAIVIATELD